MIVYMATDTENGKRYVGATGMPFRVRQGMHHAASKKSTFIFHQALRNRRHLFTWEILAECDSKELLNLAEQEAIEKFKTHVSQGGYNMTTGGISAPQLTAEQIRKGAETRRGAKRTVEMRERMRSASTSRKIPIDAYQDILSMRERGMSYPEIGRFYACTEAAVRKYVYRSER